MYIHTSKGWVCDGFIFHSVSKSISSLEDTSTADSCTCQYLYEMFLKCGLALNVSPLVVPISLDSSEMHIYQTFSEVLVDESSISSWLQKSAASFSNVNFPISTFAVTLTNELTCKHVQFLKLVAKVSACLSILPRYSTIQQLPSGCSYVLFSTAQYHFCCILNMGFVSWRYPRAEGRLLGASFQCIPGCLLCVSRIGLSAPSFSFANIYS